MKSEELSSQHVDKTLDRLNLKCPEEQDRLVLFSILQARQVRAIKKKRLNHMNKVYLERQNEKNQKNHAFRTRTEKKIKFTIPLQTWRLNSLNLVYYMTSLMQNSK